MELWQILVLAVVQGIAEFLPISSSGHVVILASLMAGGNAEALDVAEVNIVLHLGTLGSIAIFYWRRIVRLLNEDRATIRLLIVGTIPGVAAGGLRQAARFRNSGEPAAGGRNAGCHRSPTACGFPHALRKRDLPVDDQSQRAADRPQPGSRNSAGAIT